MGFQVGWVAKDLIEFAWPDRGIRVTWDRNGHD